MTSRLQEIKDWLHTLFPQLDLSRLNYIQADASSRKYLRLNIADSSYILMDTQPGPELTNFIKIAQFLATHHINVPEIIHSNIEKGLLLITDLGNKTYMEALKNATSNQVDSLYMDALATLLKIQQIPCSNDVLNIPHMDSAYIEQRLQRFGTWYLQTHLGISLDARVTSLLAKMQTLFSAVFAELPTQLVHVDYHCRNLMLLANNNPGVLDFQDAMLGPFTYDLVSLFQDAYVSWPRAQVESWVCTYRDMALAVGIIPPIANKDLLRNFDLVGLQRHIKNLGNFARLHHRDQKSHYLHDIPTLLKYINETCNRYTELSWLQEFIEEVVPV